MLCAGIGELESVIIVLERAGALLERLRRLGERGENGESVVECLSVWVTILLAAKYDD